MTNTGNGSANKQSAGNEVQEDAHVYEDEINLMDYFLVLWKHKWFILVCSVLPALIVGVCIYLSPRSYVVTYTYDVKDDARGDVRGDVRGDIRDDVSSWNLNEKNFNVLQSRFYSEDNLNRIIDNLQTNKLDEYAEHVRNFKADVSRKFVEFEVSPPFIDLSRLKVADPDQLEKLRDMKAFLLKITIMGKPLEDIGKIALVIRDNFEKVAPLYMIQEQLSTDIRGYNSKLANIESSRFGLELDLKNNTEILAGLKKVDVTNLDEKGGEVVLQFDVGRQSQYLPLSYQVQAVESKIVEVQGQINANTANYTYYEALSGLSSQMVAELNDKLSSSENYTIELFKSFLADLIGEIKEQELKDYLASYIKKIENRISVSVPVSKTPKISSIAKGTVKKTGVAFAAFLMLSVFAAFLREGVCRRHAEGAIRQESYSK
ncbi:MAG: hypothetical protein DRP66_10220 [Planctomycetota bacterium]|nr:MAG: hypothetical protein DRP66_10220 [Planctomycetota bacterium]